MVVCFRQAHQTVSQYRKRPKVTTRYLPNSQPLGLVTFGEQKTLDKVAASERCFRSKRRKFVKPALKT